VHCAALPESGLGVALKCADGAARAAQVLMAAAIAHGLPLSGKEREALAGLARPALRNWNGIEVGQVRLVAEARGQLRALDKNG
jgi:L-asparaginase II